jgi:hypothetical protein
VFLCVSCVTTKPTKRPAVLSLFYFVFFTSFHLSFQLLRFSTVHTYGKDCEYIRCFRVVKDLAENGLHSSLYCFC